MFPLEAFVYVGGNIEISYALLISLIALEKANLHDLQQSVSSEHISLRSKSILAWQSGLVKRPLRRSYPVHRICREPICNVDMETN